MLLIIVIPSTLLWESVTICHLNPPQTDEVTAFARGWERRPSKYRVGPGGDLGRRFGERGSDSASLAHRSAEEVVGASTTIEASMMRERRRVVDWRELSEVGVGCNKGAGLASIDKRGRGRRIRRAAQGAGAVFEYHKVEVNGRLCRIR
jgi:hypothetical protein